MILSKEECQIPELEFNGSNISVLEFPIKYLFENIKCDIEFIHKSIYEYFLSEHISLCIYNEICLNTNSKPEESLAGLLGKLFIKNRISYEVLEFLKYTISNGVLNNLFDKINETFKLMLSDGMTYYINKCYKNVILCEFTIFANMFELISLWGKNFLNYGDLIKIYLEHDNSLNLSRAVLSNSDLREANLRGADLRGADLRGADLREADLREAHLNCANLTEVSMIKANLIGAFISNAKLRKADLTGADLAEINFYKANLSQCLLRETNLYKSNLMKVDLRGAQLQKANLRGTNLKESNLKSKTCNQNIITILREADLRQANLSGIDLKQANLRGADLRGAILNNTNFEEADIEQSIWSKNYIKKEFLKLNTSKFKYIIEVDSNERKKIYKSELFYDNN